MRSLSLLVKLPLYRLLSTLSNCVSFSSQFTSLNFHQKNVSKVSLSLQSILLLVCMQQPQISFTPTTMIKTLFSLLILSLLYTNSISRNLNSTETICPWFRCGEDEGDVTIGYPFWENSQGTAKQYCGYPQFGLTCSPEGETILKLPGDGKTHYYVKDINYKDQTLTLVDADVVSSDCPRVRQNISLESVPLNYSPSNLNLSFYFNCTKPPSATLSPIDCLGSGSDGRRAYVSVVGGESDGYDWAGICEEKVVTAVIKDQINVDDLIDTFGGAMKEGFVLKWRTEKEEKCGTCEKNGGRCAYNATTTPHFLCFCKNDNVSLNQCKGHNGSILSRLLIGIGVGIVGILSITITICCFGGKRISSNNSIVYSKRNKNNDQNVEAFIRQHGSLAPKRYSYADIKKITYSFRDKLGQGGYGGVYKGKLFDGRLVAVKVLNESKGNGEEFINEVSSISRTSHVNVVTLLGFCFDGRKRGLIYEFMPNGSLEKFIYDDHPSILDNRHLGWEKLYQILIGIARGLEYLHRGCNTRILHFDIKPHNILLDEDFCPKIADFGLAKLCLRKESIVSMLGARGTIGYIAPEVFCRNFGVVSHKSDVYSYGMMILEMVGGRKNINVGVSQSSSEVYFPNWIYKRLELENDFILEGVTTEAENEIVRKMILVGLWCIQTDPSHRPSISKVMDMLQGSIAALQIPPKPFLSSPPRSPPYSSTISTSSVL